MVTPLALFKNNASSRLYAAIDAVTTSIRVQDGHGAKFPQPAVDQFFMVTIEDRRSGQIEICKATARSGDIITVQRAQESTTSQAFALGATVSHRFTAGTLATYFNYAWSQSEADDRFVNVSGDGMTGPLILPGDPTLALHAASKDYVDRRVADIDRVSISSNVSLVYQPGAPLTVLNLNTSDIYGQTYNLNPLMDEPVEVFVNRQKMVLNNVGGLGDYTVNKAANTITFDVAVPAGQFIAVDIYTPRDIQAGPITINLLQPIVPDGADTTFTLRIVKDNSLVNAVNSEDVMIYVNNVQQVPRTDYTVAGAELTFSEAPEADADIWGIWIKTAPGTGG
jgi:hypothetical protein